MPVINILAPFGGQNNRDGNYSLKPIYSASLYNFVPGPGFLDARGPVRPYSTNDVLPDDIQAIWPNANGSGIFATPTSIYAVATVIGAPLATGFANGLWHGNLWQNRTILCNGVDTPQIYDGATVVPIVAAGPTLTNLFGSTTFKGRVFYWENNARVFWYAAAGAFQGALTSFDLSTFTRSDGYLVSIAPLTIDGGAGPDDILAFLFSNGEVLVYQGDDPGSATAWQQVGRFMIGSMLGRDCWAIVGSATLVATSIGVVDLARALSSGAVDDSAVVGQNFGASNMSNNTSSLVTASHRKLLFDQKNRILWLALYDPSTVATVGVAIIYGMDVETRGWFTLQGVAWENLLPNVSDLSLSTLKRTTSLGIVGNQVLYGADSKLLKGPDRSSKLGQDDYFAGIDNPIFYSSFHPALDFGDQITNKLVTAIDVFYENISDVPVGIMEVNVRLRGWKDVIVSEIPVSFGEFNSIAAFGRTISFRADFRAKSGVRWYSTRFMLQAGNNL